MKMSFVPAALSFLSLVSLGSSFIIPSHVSSRNGRRAFAPVVCGGSFLEDAFGGLFFNASKVDDGSSESIVKESSSSAEAEKEEMSVAAFQAEVTKRTDDEQDQDDDEEFDGYALRDVIKEKWGHCFDVDFQPVVAFGARQLYLNILPFRLGSRRFRHETELDYLCHLLAVSEILLKYDQIGYVLYQIGETNKKPRAGTSLLVAVPLRLDLTPEQVDSILGY